MVSIFILLGPLRSLKAIALKKTELKDARGPAGDEAAYLSLRSPVFLDLQCLRGVEASQAELQLDVTVYSFRLGPQIHLSMKTPRESYCFCLVVTRGLISVAGSLAFCIYLMF